jgi:hypothetical protein
MIMKFLIAIVLVLMLIKANAQIGVGSFNGGVMSTYSSVNAGALNGNNFAVTYSGAYAIKELRASVTLGNMPTNSNFTNPILSQLRLNATALGTFSTYTFTSDLPRFSAIVLGDIDLSESVRIEAFNAAGTAISTAAFINRTISTSQTPAFTKNPLNIQVTESLNADYPNTAIAVIFNTTGIRSIKLTQLTTVPASQSHSVFFAEFATDKADAPVGYGAPGHLPATTLFLGATAGEAESTATNNAAANGDDGAISATVIDDEDGVASFSVINTSTSSYSITTSVANTTGANASLYGYIDFNRDGDFLDANEISTVTTVANGATSAVINWASTPTKVPGGTYVRIRLATLISEVNTPSAIAGSGEVEDYYTIIYAQVAGTVFKDANGTNNAAVDGTGLGNPSGTTLYAYLVNSSTNLIIKKSTVIAATGVYSFSDVDPTVNYNVIISSTSAAIGATSPAITLPTTWAAVGETFGTNNTIGTGIEGSSPNLTINLTINSADVTSLNFGIEIIPTNTSVDYNLATSPSYNTNKAVTAANGMGTLTGNDTEDGAMGSGKNLQITSLASMNGNQLYYDANNDGVLSAGELLATNSIITSYDPALLKIKYVGLGSLSASFSFSFIDNASKIGTSGTIGTFWTWVLPITLSNFVGQVSNNIANISCDAYSLTAGDQLVLLQSTNGFDFNEVNTILVEKNSSVKNLAYSVTLLSGINYFKLASFGKDGSASYSDIINLKQEGLTLPINHQVVYDNNTSKILLQVNNEGTYKIDIYNLNGQLVVANLINQQMEIGNSAAIALPNTTLNAGTYILHITSPTGVSSLKWINN